MHGERGVCRIEIAILLEKGKRKCQMYLYIYVFVNKYIQQDKIHISK